MYHILICDDEKDIVNVLKVYLSNLSGEELVLYEAYNGKEALDILEREEIHLVLMDIMMPELDGTQTLVRIRQRYNVPVILLTAKSEDADKVLGLNLGADDYITKPFQPLELMARVRSQLRRYMQLGGSNSQKDRLTIGDIEIDNRRKLVTVNQVQVNLTPIEYDILKLLMEKSPEVLSPREIYQKVWKEEPYGANNIVAVHVRHLREKLEANPGEPKYLKVVWGKGYKIES